MIDIGIKNKYRTMRSTYYLIKIKETIITTYHNSIDIKKTYDEHGFGFKFLKITIQNTIAKILNIIEIFLSDISNNLLNILFFYADQFDKILRKYEGLYDVTFYIMTLNKNRSTALKMYMHVVKELREIITDNLISEIEGDERFKDYTQNNGVDLVKDVDTVFQNEKEKLYSLNNYDLYKMSNRKITQHIQIHLDIIFNDYNRMFSNEKFYRRIVRSGNTPYLFRVSEEIKDCAWNVVEPWGQRYCLTKKYVGDISLKEIEKEFNFYPREEVLTFLTGDPLQCVVFPKTSLSKILKVLNSINIHKSLSISKN